jgi:hypothetical protein
MPKQVRLDGKIIEVVLRGGKPSRLKAGYTLSGEYKGGKIYVHRKQTKEDLRRTFISELMHHLWERSKLSEIYTRATEEAVVHELEPWVLQVLRENPEMVEYLIEEDL